MAQEIDLVHVAPLNGGVDGGDGCIKDGRCKLLPGGVGVYGASASHFLGQGNAYRTQQTRQRAVSCVNLQCNRKQPLL
jgi:hypothetical protein